MDTIGHEEETKLTIAQRTRSHLRIDDFVPKDNLDFPDVDMNLYRNPEAEGDVEYKKFLNQCYSEEIGIEPNTDDNDPEYVYNDDIFSHGWRFDLNEVSELNRDDVESQQIFEHPQSILKDGQGKEAGTSDVIDEPEFSCASKPRRRKIDMFADPEFVRVLDQQLRQHIQLLTQTFLLTKNTTNMRNEAEEARGHLCSYMRIFKHKSKPSNLLAALDLVNGLPAPKDVKSSIRLSWRQLPVPESVRDIIRNHPNIFIYPSLLPQVAFSILPERLVPKKPKINFTVNEDKLLAYALNEFKGESSPYAFIASLLMTAKTKTQISNHIKNIKRSPGNENNPIKLYFTNGELPDIDLNSDSHIINSKNESISESEAVIRCQIEEKPNQGERNLEINPCNKEEDNQFRHPQIESHTDARFQTPGIPDYYLGQDDLMNMDLDDLMAASTTISKTAQTNISESNKNIKNLKLKKSMLDLMSHNFLLSKSMGDLIIYDFLKTSQKHLGERNHLHLLQLFSDLLRREANNENEETIVTVYKEVSKFLSRIDAPSELHEKLVLFLDLEQATKCGCSLSYLHWMRFFEFMQHIELYHDGVETLEKKLARLIDALMKDDPHKVKLAIGNLVNKHPFLRREFESLSLDEKPHPSLFICEEDFDDITEPISMHDSSDERDNLYNFEHFNSKLTGPELSYASQSCPCKCHPKQLADNQQGWHCDQCNLKFIRGRMYLVNKIKPILAEWSYSDQTSTQEKQNLSGWTFEEDREILEFCRSKAVQNEDTVSFDVSTFEELVKNCESEVDKAGGAHLKSARDYAERFNQLMEMYRAEN